MKPIPIYTIQNFNFSTVNGDLYLNSFKEHLKEHPFIEKLHRHNFHLLVLFTKGSGTHTIDFKKYGIQKGSLFVVQPGQIHGWSLSEDIDGYIVFYSKEVYNLYFGPQKMEDYSFLLSAKSIPEIILKDTKLEEIAWYFLMMLNESQSKNPKRIEKILNLLDTINITISGEFSSDDNQESLLYNYRVKEFQRILEEHFISEKSPSFYAEKMNISHKHLNRICKTTLNQTATEIITNRIILEAKRMLINPKKSVSQIADDLQFINYSYFSKLFRKHTGDSPSEFRDGLIKNTSTGSM